MTIGERIQKRRTALGMTQDDLAAALGYRSRSSINKIEKDARNLTQKKIKAIADALQTTPGYIMGWADADPEVSEDVRMLSLFQKMDATDKAEMIRYAEFKLSDPKYKKDLRELA